MRTGQQRADARATAVSAGVGAPRVWRACGGRDARRGAAGVSSRLAGWRRGTSQRRRAAFTGAPGGGRGCRRCSADYAAAARSSGGVVVWGELPFVGRHDAGARSSSRQQGGAAHAYSYLYVLVLLLCSSSAPCCFAHVCAGWGASGGAQQMKWTHNEEPQPGQQRQSSGSRTFQHESRRSVTS